MTKEALRGDRAGFLLQKSQYWLKLCIFFINSLGIGRQEYTPSLFVSLQTAEVLWMQEGVEATAEALCRKGMTSSCIKPNT